MSNNLQPAKTNAVRPRRFLRRWTWRIVVLLLLFGLVYWLFLGDKREPTSDGTTFAVRRGPLRITVLEGGSFEALESQQVKSQVHGQTKILSIVEEGSEVTQADVDNGKILVELDNKELVDQQTAQELEYQNAVAAFTEAKEEYEIQINQNQSDIMTAELAAKFARMDFEKFMGVNAAGEILTKLGLNEILQAEGSETGDDAEIEPGKEELPSEDALDVAHTEIDFLKYADTAMLGDGEARQKLRKCEDDLLLAMKELGLAKTQFEGTERLEQKEFVTKNDLENERIKVERNEVSKQAAETAKDLFIKYEFPKEAEKRLSDYEEALRKLARAQKLARSKLAQADAKRKSAEARYNLQSMRRREIREQIDKCKIRAERPGLVVYANEDGWRGDDRIEEGAMVRERQKIITIPDLSQMVVKVQVHEASIKRVQKGQKARIRLDAYPDAELVGEVDKVGVLPDSQNRWMNPDMKVYETSITLEGRHDWIKPGMTAQADILVQELPDVFYVPIQAVVPADGEKVCYVASAVSTERRVVEIGEFNAEFIEIKNGLGEGEQVLLRAPLVPEEADKKEEKPEAQKPEPSPEKREAPADKPKAETAP